MKINIKNKKIAKHKKIIILVITIILILACIIPITNIVVKQNQIKQIQDKPLLEYEITKRTENNKYEILVKISPVLYGIFLILLVAVMFTIPVNGATSWFNIGGFSFQPSEFAKVAVILFLTFIISKIQERYKDEINKPVKLLIIFIALAIPLLLIIKQPDYGTAMAFCIATGMMLFTAGIDKKYIIVDNINKI